MQISFKIFEVQTIFDNEGEKTKLTPIKSSSGFSSFPDEAAAECALKEIAQPGHVYTIQKQFYFRYSHGHKSTPKR